MKKLCLLSACIIALAIFNGVPNFSAAPIKEKAPIENTVLSPDEKISLAFSLTNGTPAYSVNFNGRPVILPSVLGFQLNDGAMKSGFTLLDTKRTAKNEAWIQPWGEQREVRNHYNELAVLLQGDQGRELKVIFRAFDNAIAFRYEWPKQAALTNFEIMDELTEFVFPSDVTALWQPALRPQQTEQLYAKPA